MTEEQTQEIEKTFAELIEFKTQWKAEVNNADRVVWPNAMKVRVLKLFGLGVPRKIIAERTGISYNTMGLWKYRKSKTDLDKLHGFHEVGVSQSKEMVTVTVGNEQAAKKRTSAPLDSGLIRVRTPKGYEFDGLSQVEFFELIRCLGGLRAL